MDAPGATALPKVGASSYLLADLDTGEVLAAKDPHGRLRPASTLKVLTALTLLPKLDPDAVYTARWEDANAEGSRAGHGPGRHLHGAPAVPGASSSCRATTRPARWRTPPAGSRRPWPR